MNAGGNFDEKLYIDNDGHLVAAKGPLEVRDQPKDIELYAWVFQTQANGKGAVYISELGKNTFSEDRTPLLAEGQELTQWDSTKGERDDHGKFEPGTATGFALTIATGSDQETFVTWWADMVTLERESSAGATSR
jgi:hypothetical protein